MTFKQLEALYWINRLGSFAAAAARLHTTQSAISKRVHELESEFDTPLFDRTQRQARLTDKGQEMVVIAERLLKQRDMAIEQFGRPDVVQRRFRIGVTELTALTWLPKLVSAIQLNYPKVTLEPDVDMSVKLKEKLLADEVDLIVVPDAVLDSRFGYESLATVDNVWMCKPGLVPTENVLRIHELARLPLLTQGDRSGTGVNYMRWFHSLGVEPDNTISSNSLIALLGLTVSGLGVSYLPRACMEPMLKNGLLSVVRTNPPLPNIRYIAMYKRDVQSPLTAAVTMMAQECCDFTRMFQTP
ncbi:LysR family transcriptional regulator [Pigmentiphaga aceris]|uniref:LysR family transcriptional regulator n=1 Tax=Pigmentiphaga aceris TaxID=1940612 RepID=A0A5C0B5J8_9BURK|nr:LysR family transcriptional regulator [Pigmentiphaga aceris]QEI09535.1 LysR family transcriptional regulator [Pigmentiphaga aceris]